MTLRPPGPNLLATSLASWAWLGERGDILLRKRAESIVARHRLAASGTRMRTYFQEIHMSDMHEPGAERDGEKVPLVQQLLDNPFLLLFLGVLIPSVVYTLWGVIDILTVPLAK